MSIKYLLTIALLGMGLAEASECPFPSECFYFQLPSGTRIFGPGYLMVRKQLRDWLQTVTGKVVIYNLIMSLRKPGHKVHLKVVIDEIRAFDPEGAIIKWAEDGTVTILNDTFRDTLLVSITGNDYKSMQFVQQPSISITQK